MTLIRVTAVDYRTRGDEEPVVKLCGRDEHGERRVHHITGTRPYLYVLEDEPIPEGHKERIIEEVPGFNATDPRSEYDGAALKRWLCRVPGDVSEIKKGVEETWESDVPYYRRCSIDYDLSGHVEVPDEREFSIEEVDTDPEVAADEEIEPRVVYGDIEVLMGEGSVDAMLEEASQPVTAVSLYDSYEERYDVYALDPDEKLDNEAVGRYLEEEDHDTDEYPTVLHTAESEEALLDSVLGYFEDTRPDLTTGWHWVDFDILYLLRRLKNLDMDLDRLSDAGGTKRHFRDYHGDLARAIVGVPAVDLMKLFFDRMEFTRWRSKSLDYVAQEVTGRGKISDVNVNYAYEHDRARLAAYNVIDVRLCVEIDAQRDVIETCMGLAEESQIQLYDVFSEMRLVDGYIMSRADDDEVLPEQQDADIPENAGGLVLEPSDGVSEWVGVVDLKSLYPSAMITWNISPETVKWLDSLDDPDLHIPWVPPADEVRYPLGEDQISWNRLGTSLEEEGIVPKYLKLLFADRDAAKETRDSFDPDSPEYESWDRKQYGLKVIMNSFYGVSSNDHWRMAKHGLGDAITSAARYALWKGKDITERLDYEVLYGDTDSCFISLERTGGPANDERYREKAILDGKGLTRQINEGMVEAIRESGLEGDHPFLDGSLSHATDAHCLKYEFEKLYRRYIQYGKKKRYAGLVVWKDGKEVEQVDITGLEANRSDTPELAAEAQVEVLRRVLAGEDFESIAGYVSGLCRDIKQGRVPLSRIARPKSLGKALSDYDTQTQTVKACRASMEQLDKTWAKSDDPFLVFLKSTPPMEPAVSVIALDWNDDLPNGYEVDAEEHIRICLEAPLEAILEELGWEWKEVRTGVRAGDAMEGDWGDPNVTVAAGEVEDDDTSRQTTHGQNDGETEGQRGDSGGDGLSGNTPLSSSDESSSGRDGGSADALEVDW